MALVAAEGASLHGDDIEQYIKFERVIYDWPRSLSYNASTRPSDIQALKLHLDTRNWNFPQDDKEEKNSSFLINDNGKQQHQSKRGIATRSAVDACECLFLNKRSELRNEAEAGAESEDDEEEFIELFVAQFEDMRQALLFTIRSVKRFAQRLSDLGRTTKVLPLPPGAMSSEQIKSIKRIDRRKIKSQVQLKGIQLAIAKENKRVTHEENMSKWAKEYEQVRRVWQSQDHSTFIGVDTETLENGHHEMLEMGWSVVGPHRLQETFHYILEEAYTSGLKNGRWVADNRQHFQFGKVLSKPLVGHFPTWTPNGSEIATIEDTGRYFMDTINGHRRKGPVYIVFHDSKGDLEVMDEFGIDTRDWSFTMLGKGEGDARKSVKKRGGEATGDPHISHFVDHKQAKPDANEKLHPVYILDTQLLFAAVRCGGTGAKFSLKNICVALDVNGGKLGYFHNAANDAHYTAAALVKMAEGPHLTEMRKIAEARLAQEEKKMAKQPKAAKWAPKVAASWD